MSEYQTRATLATEGTYNPDHLLAGAMPVKTRKVTIGTSQTIVRGHVLGQITSGGNVIVSLSAASDGSQTPRFIAAESITTSGSTAEAIVYEAGDFNEAALTLGASHTIASIREALRGLGIFLSNGVAR
jgi:hypothetical protein